MLMMGLTDEYKRGIAHVSTLNFTSGVHNFVVARSGLET